MRVYDKRQPGQPVWPKWWEDSDYPDDFGNVCVICGREMPHTENSMAAAGIDWQAAENDNDYGSGFCVCIYCLQNGRRLSATNIDRHDRAVLQRFDAVYRALQKEIRNGKQRAEGWGSIGAVQSGWAHYGHHYRPR